MLGRLQAARVPRRCIHGLTKRHGLLFPLLCHGLSTNTAPTASKHLVCAVHVRFFGDGWCDASSPFLRRSTTPLAASDDPFHNWASSISITKPFATRLMYCLCPFRRSLRLQRLPINSRLIGRHGHVLPTCFGPRPWPHSRPRTVQRHVQLTSLANRSTYISCATFISYSLDRLPPLFGFASAGMLRMV